MPQDQRTWTAADWARMAAEQAEDGDAREFDMVWLLFLFGATIYDGMDVHQVDHALAMAQMAATDGADPELVVVALLHDIAKPLAMVNHPQVAAEILAPRLTRRGYDLVRLHSQFLGEQIHGTPPADAPTDPGLLDDARRLAGWDARAVDPGAPRMPLRVARRLVAALYGQTR